MDSPNFIIDGRLGVPGPRGARVPPPFGTPRDIIEAIEARRAAALTKDVIAALRAGTRAPVPGWRARVTAITVAVACTMAAALIGSYTGQRNRLLPAVEDMPTPDAAQVAPLQPIAPPQAPIIHDETAAAMLVKDSTQSPEAAPVAAPVAAGSEAASAAAQTPAAIAPLVKPRTLARVVGRSVPHTKESVARPIEPSTASAASDDISVPAFAYGPPVTAYVAPGTPVRIELQRHTRLTD